MALGLSSKTPQLYLGIAGFFGIFQAGLQHEGAQAAVAVVLQNGGAEAGTVAHLPVVGDGGDGVDPRGTHQLPVYDGTQLKGSGTVLLVSQVNDLLFQAGDRLIGVAGHEMGLPAGDTHEVQNGLGLLRPGSPKDCCSAVPQGDRDLVDFHCGTSLKGKISSILPQGSTSVKREELALRLALCYHISDSPVS